MLQSTVTARGQTTLPKDVREALGLGPGDRLRYVVEDGGVRIVKAAPVMRLAGVLTHDGPPVALDAMDAAVAAEAAERDRAGRGGAG